MSAGDVVVVSRPAHDGCVAGVEPTRWLLVGPGKRWHGPARGLVAWLVGALVVALPAGVLAWLGGLTKQGGEIPISGTLKGITTAQTLFAQGDREDDLLRDYAVDLDELVVTGLIAPPADADAHEWAGYTVRMARGHPLAEWCVTADPVDPRYDRRFWVNQSGEIHWVSADEAPPLVLDPQAGPPVGWRRLYR